MIDIKQLTQQKNELKEVWDYLGIDSAFPDKQVRQWLLDFGKDEIEAAFMVLSKREHDVNDAAASASSETPWCSGSNGSLCRMSMQRK